MSTPIAALCQFLVEDVYGVLAAQVFETLCTHGRLSLPALIARSRLNPRQVRHSLTVLVQQNFAVWSRDNGGDAVSYEANVRNAYNIVRYGKCLRVVAGRFGRVGQLVIAALIQSGHGRVGDVVNAVVQEEGEKNNTDTGEGDDTEEAEVKARAPKSSAPIKSEADLKELANEARACIVLFVQHGFLAIVHESHFHPSADNRTSATSIQYREHASDKVKKVEEAAFQANINRRLVDWQYNRPEREQLLKSTSDLKVSLGSKRSASTIDGRDATPASKKPRLDNLNDAADTDPKISWHRLKEGTLSSLDRFLVKINFDKLSVVERAEQAVELSNVRIGRATSFVYRELLQKLGQQQLFCKDPVQVQSDRAQAPSDDEEEESGDEIEEDPATMTIREITSQVDFSSVDARFGKSSANGVDRSRRTLNGDNHMDISDEDSKESRSKPNNAYKHEDEDGDDDGEEAPRRGPGKQSKRKAPTKATLPHDMDIDDDDSGGPNDKLSLVRQHLLLLKEYAPKLARPHQAPQLHQQVWTVNFAALSHHLRLNMMDDIVRAKFGVAALRLVRILREKGKLEQKHLSNFSLMNHKHQLQTLTSLHTNGYVDLQEVPKDSTRTPGKTIFLWFFDERRCAIKMLEDTYRAMTRILQRVRLEREKFRNLLEKTERSDVKGNEDEMLTKHEKHQLERWHKIEERLMTEVQRLDSVVFALRDF